MEQDNWQAEENCAAFLVTGFGAFSSDIQEIFILEDANEQTFL